MQTIELPTAGYTLPTAARIIGCHEKHIYRLVRSNKLAAYVDLIGRLMVSKEELYSYLKQQAYQSREE